MKISLTDLPEVMHVLRRELANLIRDVAKGEVGSVRRRLEEIAADFEAGITKPPD